MWTEDDSEAWADYAVPPRSHRGVPGACNVPGPGAPGHARGVAEVDRQIARAIAMGRTGVGTWSHPHSRAQLQSYTVREPMHAVVEEAIAQAREILRTDGSARRQTPACSESMPLKAGATPPMR